ncbi:UNVERIFIED_CONTAM: hypothetical protein Sradi_5277000 [Sesamum radiatum]|uniref:Ty3-gypsy retrotransposon protein n=1 Tax=Sesamum radiatum TaxID=300843 RepID=A0AAW2LP84_SESRA
MNEKNVLNTAGQSSTGGKIVDRTLSDNLNSVSPIEIKLKSTPFAILPAMMTNAVTMKEQSAQMAQAIPNLQKVIENKDLQITQLTSYKEHTDVEELHDSSKHASFSNHVENEKQMDKAPPMHDSVQKSTHSETSIATLSVQQLQDMITNTVKTHRDGTTQSSSAYSKPYTKRINALRMPTGYQPPKLKQFNGKGNPRQQIAHFIETCNGAGINGDLLVKSNSSDRSKKMLSTGTSI